MRTAETTVRADSAHGRTPAANALKHGLTATRFVPPEQAPRLRAIHAELILVHQPQSAEERECIDELAAARARLYDIEHAAWERLKWEKTHAAERFERRMREQFEKDLADWRDDPFLWESVFARTALGAAHLASVWSDIADVLGKGDSVCDFGSVKDAIAAEGSKWQAAQIRQAGSWIMSRYLALTADPRAELDRWVHAGRDDTSGPIADDRRRAQWHLDRTPEPAVARRELLEKAKAESERWTLLANELHADYETDRDLAADRAVGMVPGDERATRESRLALRYLTSARNLVDRLDRRLYALKKMRPLHDLRRHSPCDFRTPVVPPTPPMPEWMIADLEAMEADNEALDLETDAMEAAMEAMEADIEEEDAADAAEEERFRIEAEALQATPAKSAAPAAPDHPARRPDPAAIARAFRRKPEGR